jgi:uncharacterized membrane protein YphA (DoxX/SURF4 family)
LNHNDSIDSNDSTSLKTDTQQLNQYNHFLKNIALMGGAAFLFVMGAGRFSIDWVLARKR